MKMRDEFMNTQSSQNHKTATTEGSNPEVQINGKEKKEPMTNATTTKGVTTLKQLQKECRKIDLNQVRFKKGYEPLRWEFEEIFDPNAPLTKKEFNYDAKVRIPHIKFGSGRKRWFGGFRFDVFTSDPSKKWELRRRESLPEVFIQDLSRSLKPYDLNVVRFQGGAHGRYRCSIHNNFTDTQILYLESTDEIVGVLYALDNDYLNEWLRQTIDPNIPNNWDYLHADKEFEVIIETTTYEKVKVIGRTYNECVTKMKQNDPELDLTLRELSDRDRFSGVKRTSRGEGEEGIPSYSYEEWVSSLQVKEVA
jgi:hypothetical protein